jgi:hypothetical protein
MVKILNRRLSPGSIRDLNDRNGDIAPAASIGCRALVFWETLMQSELQLGLTADRLRELLHYSPATGLFYWRVSRPGLTAGTEAGSWHKTRLGRPAGKRVWCLPYSPGPRRDIVRSVLRPAG